MSVILETSIGDMTVDLFTEERPRCCMNFLKLCKIKYYNFSLFHTVQKDLVAQTGDPTASGRGGESIFGLLYGDQARFFDMEVVPRILHSKKGLLSMVNNGSGMHGSQFFITLADSVDYLNNKHTVFGEVAEGTDIVEKLNNAFCDDGNRPHQDIRIYHTVILDDPYDDPSGLVIPSESPLPTQEMLDTDRIPCDADIHDEEGLTTEELAEMTAEREAKANTQILEMVGDLPDQEVAPPENVLFVCKLNPVTTSDDLEIIFSRFGTIVSCDVIKDQKTGESLQYAFVEFDKQENCEMAYFKMDNVLIDDRRIHVDFSQSVSKIKWKGKGRGVDIMNDGDAPKYVLKNQQRQSHGYDLVMEDDLDDVSTVGKSHKKNKKEKKSKDDKSKSSESHGFDNSKWDNKSRERDERTHYQRDRGRRDHSREKEYTKHDTDKSRRRESPPDHFRDRKRHKSPSDKRERKRHELPDKHRDRQRHESPDNHKNRKRYKSPNAHKAKRYGSSGSDSDRGGNRSDDEKDSRNRKLRRKDYNDDDDVGHKNDRREKYHGKDNNKSEKKKKNHQREVVYNSSSEEEDQRRQKKKKRKQDYDSSEEEDRCKEKKKKKGHEKERKKDKHKWN